jgi:two-component system, OmpR family, sensor kinase
VPERATGWTLEVRDQGPGIPPKVRDRLLERFVRGEHQEPGLGLGLFLVRSLAATLGGTVELDEEVAAGACFRISFPSR